MHKGHIVAALRRDEQAALESGQFIAFIKAITIVFIFLQRAVGQFIVAGQFPVNCGDAVRVGFTAPDNFIPAIPDRDVRCVYRLRLVQRGDPHQRGFPSLFKMGREVCYKRRGLNIHGLLFAQQCLAQGAAFEFDDIKTGTAERDADHFKCLTAVGCGQ